MAAVAILGLSIGLGQIGIGHASPTGTKTPAQSTFDPRPAVRIAAGPSCTQKQGQCEDKCVSAGGGDARMNECFHKCQAAADACK